MGSGLGERPLSAPTKRAEQTMYTNAIEVLGARAGGMKHLHPVVPPSPLYTSNSSAIPNGHRVPLDLELPSPDPGN